jgi:hypothetical protein
VNGCGTSGQTNTGGGGGGSGNVGATGGGQRCGRPGGSGIVIMKVPSFYTATFSGSLTVETIPSGGFNIYKITGGSSATGVTFTL